MPLIKFWAQTGPKFNHWAKKQQRTSNAIYSDCRWRARGELCFARHNLY